MVNIKKSFIYSVVFIFILAALVFYFSSQQKNDVKKQTQILVVKSEPLAKTLYFDGVIKPLAIHTVYTPIEGDIKSIHFTYGQIVKKGQLLEVIASEKEKTDFEEALTGYLKAKQDLNTKYTTWKTTQKLYQESLVSRDTRNQDRDNYYLSEIAMIQAQTKLEQLLAHQKLLDLEQLKKLTIADIEGIKKAFESNLTFSTMNIESPIDGIALYAEDNSGDEKELPVGSHVKANQTLLRIGDLQGLTLQVKVNEYDVDSLKQGQKAIITSDAFPNITLTGFIKSVSQQATDQEGAPVFMVSVIIPEITDAVRQIVHVGMSAKIMIQLQENVSISIPITAVSQKNDASFVNVIDPQTGKITKKIIQTGDTTTNDIVVTSGLKEGDKIIAAH